MNWLLFEHSYRFRVMDYRMMERHMKKEVLVCLPSLSGLSLVYSYRFKRVLIHDCGASWDHRSLHH